MMARGTEWKDKVWRDERTNEMSQRKDSLPVSLERCQISDESVVGTEEANEGWRKATVPRVRIYKSPVCCLLPVLSSCLSSVVLFFGIRPVPIPEGIENGDYANYSNVCPA